MEQAEQVQQNNDKDRDTREPKDDITQHVDNFLQLARMLRPRFRPKANLAGTELSRCCPPRMAAHQAAPNEMIRLAAVTNPVRIAALRALSAASRAAEKASLTRRSASCCERPERCATICAR